MAFIAHHPLPQKMQNVFGTTREEPHTGIYLWVHERVDMPRCATVIRFLGLGELDID